MIPIAILLPTIAGIMVAEVLVIAFQSPARRARFLPSMLAGLCIVSAWNAWILHWTTPVVLAALTGALIAHGWDLYRRW